MAEVIELTKRRTDEVVAWACGACGRLDAQAYWAERCCRCQRCNEPLRETFGKSHGRHAHCDKAWWEEQTAERNAKATARLLAADAIPEAEHDGGVYCSDDRGPDEGFFHSTDDLHEWCLENEQEPPARVWACETVGLSIDASRIVENACEEHGEEAFDQISDEAIQGLQAALDTWCAAQGVESWRPTDKAVVLDPTAWEALKAERAEGGNDVVK
jgi:hypothetical protein